MPERAEIAHMANCLHSELINKICDLIIILPSSKFYAKPLHSSCNLQYQFNNDINNNYEYIRINMLLNQVISKGKKIIFDFGTIRFVSSCLMEGKWSFIPDNKVSIILKFGDFYVYYSDSRFEGYFSVCQYPSSEYDHLFKGVGLDILVDNITYEMYYNIIRKIKNQNTEICDFLMDQKKIAGIGNWLRAEILYCCRINPHRTLKLLSDQDIYNLLYYSKFIVIDALNKKGLTIQTYLDPYGNKGSYEPLCYGRNFDNNGFQICDTEFDKNNRRIHWCPQIQI